MRRTTCLLLVLLGVMTALVAVAEPAGAVTHPYRRWTGPKAYTCSLDGDGVKVSLANQNVEFFALPTDATFTLDYIDDGEVTTDGPFPVEQTTGTKVYGAFAESFKHYPFTFSFRVNTLINGSVVYTSTLTTTCTGNGSGNVSPVNTVVPTDPYRRWSGSKGYTCEPDGGGGVQVRLSDQDVEFNDLPGGAQFTINYIKNGLIQTDGPYAVEKANGFTSYGSFTVGFASYPFTFAFRLDTIVGGAVVYTSKLTVRCTGDGTGTVRPLNTVPSFAPFASWNAFIIRQYQDLTAQNPTTSNLNAWRENLATGAKTKGELIEGLRRSSENVANVDPVARLYRAFLGRTPDAGGLKFWVNRRRAGTWTLTKMADSFASSNEFKTKYGTLTNRQFVTRIYTDVLGRTADTAGVNYWTGRLDAHAKTRGQVMVGFSESSEYKRKQAENTDAAVVFIYVMGRRPSDLEVAGWASRNKAGIPVPELAEELLRSSAYATHITG